MIPLLRPVLNAAACTLFLVAGFGPRAAFAADPPKWTRLSVSADAARTATITWNTDSNVAGVVELGPDAKYGRSAPAEPAVQTAIGWVHVAVVAGLDPSRIYHYRVGNAQDGWSVDRELATAPDGPCESVSFVAGGDGRHAFSGASDDWPGVLDAIAAQAPDFIVTTGDTVMDGGEAAQWKSYFDRAGKHQTRIPILPAIGNHDDGPGEGEGANFNQQFALPRNAATRTEDFYSFDYGSVHVVALSTDTYDEPDMARQGAWLDADLAATKALWTVVFFHKPVYSSGNHGSNDGGKINAMVPIFDKHHVDVVLSGHDHNYERFKPMKAGAEVASYAVGTLYIVTGGAGSPMDPLFPFRAKLRTSAKSDNTFHYVHFTANRGTLTVRAERVPVGLQGGRGVIEQFTITKMTPPDLCIPPALDMGASPDLAALPDLASSTPADMGVASAPDLAISADLAAGDAGAPRPDLSVAKSGDDAGDGGGTMQAGCGCRVPGRAARDGGDPGAPAMALGLFVALALLRRRARSAAKTGPATVAAARSRG